MAQSFLGPNPGTLVRDADAIELADGSNITATANGTWTESARPGHVAVYLETGTCTGTGTSMDIEIQGADDDSGTNTVSLAFFGNLDQDDDDVTKVAEAVIYKPYIRYAATVSGTSPVFPTTITLRQPDDRRSLERDA